jgi:probable rRNA maturation factor
LPFVDIKNEVLGKDYDLSLVFIGDKLSKKLNKQYRGKNKPTDVLSFPLSKTDGEIFINLRLAKKEASEFERTYSNFIGFLFIHGLIHLKGFEHSSRMESEESKIRGKFQL